VTPRVNRARQLRHWAPIALGLSAAMLLPAATAPAASAPPRGVVPSGSDEPSGPPLTDAVVDLVVQSEADPVRNWAIAVTGGRPSVDVVTVPDPIDGSAHFTVAVFGQSATVEMTVTLPAGSELIRGSCFDFNEQVEHDALVAPRRLVLEVVRGGRYECLYGSGLAGAPKPTAPSTEMLAEPSPSPPSGATPGVLGVIAAVCAATLLISVRIRRGASLDRS